MSRSGRLREIIARGLAAAGVLAALRRRRARRGEVTVLMLHRVAGTSDAPVVDAFPRPLYEEVVGALARTYRLCGWNDALAATRTPGEKPALLLTFDDGYADQARVAWPAIRAVAGSAVFFVTRDGLAGRPYFWDLLRAQAGRRVGDVDPSGFHRDPPEVAARIRTLVALPPSALAARVAELRAEVAQHPEMMTLPDAARLAGEGATIGAHGVSHVALDKCDDAEVAVELARDDATLLAYPYGAHDGRVVDAARAAGYAFAFTSDRGALTSATDPWRIPRIDLTPAMASPDGRRFSAPLLEAELLGVFDALFFRSSRK